MFGYVFANKEILTEEELGRYKSCYCGLCRALKKRRGSLSRMTLNYDMTFLIMVLSAMYEPDEESGCENCAAHPFRKNAWRSSEITDYAADMNLALSYLNMLDDWNDDGNLFRLALAGLFSEEYFYVKQKYPAKCGFMEDRLKTLRDLELSRCGDPDAGAGCFGSLTGELFSFRKDSLWGGEIRAFGESLGKFIYIMDAVIDLDRDIAKDRYNPLRSMRENGCGDEDFYRILTMLIAECAGRFERLPIVTDAGIIRNILYSGVWQRYNMYIGEKKRKVAAGKDG